MRKATVTIDSHFVEYGQLLERRAEQGLGRGMGHTVAAVRKTATRYRLQTILAKTHATRVKHTPKGLAAAVTMPDFRSIFFERGTNARRKTKLTKATVARRNTPSGQARQARVANAKGVRAVHMLQRAIRDSFADVIAEIEQAMRF